MSVVLLPCPFCGSEAIHGGPVLGYAASITCSRCKGTMFGYGEEDAVAAWNRRTPGVLTINEERAAQGAPPLSDVPPTVSSP